MSEARRSTPWPPVETEAPAPHPDAPPPGTKLDMHYDQCFGCGEVEGGLHMRSTMGEHALVHSQFTVTEAHQGAPGLAHGGLLACAFDEALGSTVGNLLRRPAVTGKLETDFLRPVPVGSTLFITAKVDGVAGRKLYASAEGRLDAEDGPVALRARALFVEVGFEHFTKHGDPDAMAKFRETQGRINP
ncbi:acyl-coenzyme A thioesterase PaaI-like protein [Amycolatopsis bartoniae]|uniref:Acyl-coenzyme A thioesterase THEM4 n=1 Tax=Amycolatopsis bartoniae TaxID=941986 RepID=A0A8H9IUZ2_9PSEU|nr:PaaI family thioesterase [Amycolatopsis bartoniae]MBB2935277.1 acyl-coenzyme A thioesterase PaaI-like protein [Amycolatopsis bartoniae]TVT06817.1 PaaI family thioesterase [Amycolatopsis bartoniae]GHF55692.1 thioesterase [Amycolatopsis bartoniae]